MLVAQKAEWFDGVLGNSPFQRHAPHGVEIWGERLCIETEATRA